jgi:hypothetical protein
LSPLSMARRWLAAAVSLPPATSSSPPLSMPRLDIPRSASASSRLWSWCFS